MREFCLINIVKTARCYFSESYERVLAPTVGLFLSASSSKAYAARDHFVLSLDFHELWHS